VVNLNYLGISAYIWQRGRRFRVIITVLRLSESASFPGPEITGTTPSSLATSLNWVCSSLRLFESPYSNPSAFADPRVSVSCRTREPVFYIYRDRLANVALKGEGHQRRYRSEGLIYNRAPGVSVEESSTSRVIDQLSAELERGFKSLTCEVEESHYVRVALHRPSVSWSG
jgi:hypothetical protein